MKLCCDFRAFFFFFCFCLVFGRFVFQIKSEKMMKNSFNPGFYKLSRGRGVKKISNTFTRETRKIEQPNIFDRPTRPMPKTIFQRTTRAINKVPSIFHRLTRKIQRPADIFQRQTRKIDKQPSIYHRTTRRIGHNKSNVCTDSNNNLFSGAAVRQQLATLIVVKPCSVVLEDLRDCDWVIIGRGEVEVTQ